LNRISRLAEQNEASTARIDMVIKTTMWAASSDAAAR
jgi:hypothetical protein